MKTFKLFSMAALALAMAACSNEDSALENAAPAQQQGAMKFTATLAAPGSATTRTVYTEVTESTDPDYNKIKVAWKAGDQISLYDENNGAKCPATVGTPAGDGSATISGTFSQQVQAEHSIIATYPVSAAEDLVAFNAKFTSQAGTRDYIQDNLDYRIGPSTISVTGDQATLATALQMESQIAIWKLTLQDNAATPAALSATKVTIKNGSTVIAATTDITATSAVYLALNLKSGNISNADITIEATVGSDTYTYSKSGVSLAKGNYYQSTVTMTKFIDPNLLSGVFSVSSTKKVNFSKGNLRYASSKWSFFDNQYDYYTDYSADAWDKFGWSTSATTYGMNTSKSNNDYSGNFVDWGSNSDLQTALGTGWRTLSSAEWTYLFNTRSASTVGGTENGRYAKAKVNDVMGVILFPDTYTHPDGVTAPTGVNATGDTGWNGNNYSSADWTKMESAGCVFLPTAGYRSGTTVLSAGFTGSYWSATPYQTGFAYGVSFYSNSLNPADFGNRYNGYSVRLVK